MLSTPWQPGRAHRISAASVALAEAFGCVCCERANNAAARNRWICHACPNAVSKRTAYQVAGFQTWVQPSPISPEASISQTTALTKVITALGLSYACAKGRGSALLYKGNDFSPDGAVKRTLKRHRKRCRSQPALEGNIPNSNRADP